MIREFPRFLLGPADQVAPQILGWHLASTILGVVTVASLTEVEAYTPDDPASHAFGGFRPGNAAMFGPPGTLYVYRSYGIHFCANIVCGDEGTGAAVLARGAVPVEGIDAMVLRRGRSAGLLDGPGKLTQALGIDLSHNGIDLFDRNSSVLMTPGSPPRAITAAPRIGISKAVERPWRFVSVP